MARPCGCAGGGCTARGVDGIRVTGTCGINDPLTIGLADPLGTGCEPVLDCVGGNLGAGLVYNDPSKVISARRSGDAGNLLGFGSDGGLLVTGDPDPGQGGVTVDSLPATNVLGGTYGAGFLHWPEGTLAAYEAATQIDNLHMAHVPVRRGEEQMLWALHHRTMATYTSVSAATTTDTFGTQEAPYFFSQPSGPLEGDGTYNPLAGYWGYEYPREQGFPELSDVFRVSARRIVLYLENKDLGDAAGIDPVTSLAQTGRLVQKWGLQRAVIVGSELPLTGGDVPSIKAGLGFCRGLGMEIAAHLTSQAMADANPPADLIALRCTWVFADFARVSDASITTYKDAGLNVMLFNGDRQEHWAQQRALGVRGLLSSDPVYTAAPTYGFRYRPINPPDDPHPWNTIASADYGRVSNSGALAAAHGKFRGYVARGAPGILQFPPDAVPPANSGFNIPPGRWNPIWDPDNPDPPEGEVGAPTNYDIEVGVSATAYTSSGQALGVIFGNVLDNRFLDLTAANAKSKGYSFVLARDGNFVFRRYDGIPGTWQYQLIWASGWGPLTANTEYRIAVQVRPGSVRVGPLTANGGITGPNSRLFEANNPPGDPPPRGDLWRGPYFYLTFNRPPVFTGFNRFHTLKVTNL